MMQTISVTDLTDTLQGPDREQVIHNVRTQLDELANRIDQETACGVKPEEFEKQQKVRDAVSCSIRFFEAYIQK